jgi:hypothetical protein
VLVAPLTAAVMSSVTTSDEGLASGINNAAGARRAAVPEVVVDRISEMQVIVSARVCGVTGITARQRPTRCRRRVLTEDEARRVAINIARLPGLLEHKE